MLTKTPLDHIPAKISSFYLPSLDHYTVYQDNHNPLHADILLHEVAGSVPQRPQETFYQWDIVLRTRQTGVHRDAPSIQLRRIGSVCHRGANFVQQQKSERRAKLAPQTGQIRISRPYSASYFNSLKAVYVAMRLR